MNDCNSPSAILWTIFGFIFTIGVFGLYCYQFLTSKKNNFKGNSLTPEEAEIEYDLDLTKALSQPKTKDSGGVFFAIFIIAALVMIVYLRYL